MNSGGAEFVVPAMDYAIAGSRVRSSRFPSGIVDSSRGLICIPGYGSTGECFARLRPLAGAYDMHLLTLPEEAVRSADPLARFATIVEAFAERFDRPVLLGTSFGGAIAIKAAAELGRNIAGLVLISAFASSPRSGMRAIMPALPLLEWAAGHVIRAGVRLAGGRLLDQSAALELIRETSSISPAERHARLLATLRCDVGSEASRIDVPVLILHGAADHVVPPASAKRLAVLIPHAELQEIAGAGHVVYLTHAAVVNATLSRFLARCFGADHIMRRHVRAS